MKVIGWFLNIFSKTIEPINSIPGTNHYIREKMTTVDIKVVMLDFSVSEVKRP